MGYRIGSQCFATHEGATDFQMSMVAPTITQDGAMLHPIKQNDQLTFAGQTVHLSFGQCDPQADFAAGLKIAMAFIVLCAVAWGLRFLTQFVYKLGSQPDTEA